MSKTPQFNETLEQLDAGVLLNKLSRACADVALGVIDAQQKGKNHANPGSRPHRRIRTG